MFSKGKIQDMCMLTPMQESMLYFNKRAESDDNRAYFQQIHTVIKGKMNISYFRQAVHHLVEKYDILRTAFLSKGVSKPVQIILKEREIEVNFEDITTKDIDKEEFLENVKVREKERGFDLLNDPLVRVSVFKEAVDTYSILFSFHHIILDGWSLSNLLLELKEVYSELTISNQVTFSHIKQFPEYLSWLEKQDKEDAKDFWKNYLSGYRKKATINTRNRYITNKTENYQKVIHVIGEEKSEQLHFIAKQYGLTLASMFNTMWGIILQRYNRTDDVVFANVVSGRNANIDGIEEMVGMFINSVPVRVTTKEHMTLKDLLFQVHEEGIVSAESSYLSLSEIQSLTELKSNLIDNVLVFENYPFDDDLLKSSNEQLDFQVDKFEATGYSNYGFNLTIYDGKKMTLSANVNIDLYDRRFVENILESFELITDAMIDDLDSVVNEINLVSETQRESILKISMNDYSSNLLEKKPITVNTILQQVFQENENQPALVYKNKFLTYGELNKRANQLAKKIRAIGCKSGDVIGVHTERSLEMIVAVVAIIKAGGVYLPLNNYYPDNVIKNILEENKAPLVLTYNRTTEEKGSPYPANTRALDIALDNQNLYSGDDWEVMSKTDRTSLLYLLYTSGTTGKPKGVGVEHRQLINTIEGLEQEIYKHYPNYLRIGLVAPNFFDASIKQIFASLLLGHRLHIVDEGTRFNGKQLMEYIISEEIDVIDGTPAHLRMMNTSYELIDEEKRLKIKLKCMLVGGETLLKKDVQDFLENYQLNDFNLINVYGLTETAVDTTTYRINRENIKELKQIPIGKPLPNQSVLILDENENLVPIGVEGEIYIGGDSVARGYIHDVDLQEQRYVAIDGFGSKIFYKTGDIGLWSEDGNILYRGRVDSQVKIRGYRIELTEIEHVLNEYEWIHDVAVLAIEKDHTDYLHAFFVSGQPIDVHEVRNFLIDKLPQYMVPSFYSQIEKIPVKESGKIDTYRLRKMTGNTYNLDDYVAPSNQTEAKLVQLWKDILSLKRISIRDNFFHIGGHSIKAMEIIMQISKEFRIDIPFKYFFDHPTIQELSHYLIQADSHDFREIKATEKKEYYPVSSQQKRMYTFFKFDPKSIAYNIVMPYKLTGEIDYYKLQEAVNQLVRRHEILRTLYTEVNGQVVQRVLDTARIPIQYIKLEVIDEVSEQQVIHSYLRAFDLNKEIPFEMLLFDKDADKSILLLNMHHISFDGIAVSTFMEELYSLYLGNSLAPIELQYKDFAVWEQGNKGSKHQQKSENYWRKTLAGELPVLDFPLDYQRPAIRDYRGSHLTFELEGEILQILKDISAKTEATLYTVLYSLFNLTLYKYTGQKDFLTGTITSGRSHIDIKNTLGMFVNTSAIRTVIDETIDLEIFIKEQKDTILEMLDNQEYPFDHLLELMDVQVEKNRNPIFDILFSLNNYAEFALPPTSEITSIEEMDVNLQAAKFDFALMGTEKKDKLVFRLEYRDRLFKRESMERFMKHFIHLIQNSSSFIHQQLQQIPLIDEQEQKQVHHVFNNTNTEYPREKSLKDLFEEQCMLTPENRALVYNNESISYKKLNELANQVAHYLHSSGLESEEVVGISMEQGFYRIAAILGIIKAGATFLPIDETYPKERITYMLKDSDTNLLIIGDTFNINVDVKVVPIKSEVIRKQKKTNLEKYVSPSNLAYIMYTSGSTGQPKGVMVEHRNVVRLIKNTNFITFKESDRIIQGSTIVFDASTLEIWGALLNGLELHLMDKDSLLSPEKLRRILEEEQITILWLTAPLFNQISKENPSMFKSLRYLLVGGDALAPEPIEKVRHACPNIKIINGYGPTENTTFSTTHLIDKKYTANIPIGKPIANSKAYIMDPYLNLQPIGALGEIFVGGDGVARGYLNNSKLTNERFIENPFIPGERLYRTGDIGRWQSDGSIEYLGRADQQVKIRGFRIELGEIINTLLLHPMVKEATVLMKEKESLGKYMTAFVVLEAENVDEDIESVTQFLKMKLPEYMHPAFILEVDEIPLTLNGKVDKHSLLAYEEDSAIEQMDESINHTESKLLAIWQDVFGKEDIRINDDFFYIGGHSLIAIELLAKVRKIFGIDVSIRELFIQSTIKNLAHYIENSQPLVSHHIPKTTEKSSYALTMAQEKLYALQMVEKDNLVYNMPKAFTIYGDLDIAILKDSFEKIIGRHEAFRTTFHTKRNQIVQRIHPKTIVDFEYKKISKLEIESTLENSIQPFELSKAPLVRMKVFLISEDHYILFLDMHHIISDGTSFHYFMDELFKVYQQGGKISDEVIEIQPKDFAEWQKNLYEQPEMKEKETYWLDTFKTLPELNLPYDYLKTSEQRFDGSQIKFDLGPNASRKMMELASTYNCTPNVIFLSVFSIVLSIYSQQEEVIFGTSVNGRKQQEIDRTIGMFTRTLPMKNKVSRHKTMTELISEVKNNLIDAIDHQEYEGEKLLDSLNIFANRGKNTLVDAVFTHDIKKKEQRAIQGLEVIDYPLSFEYAKFDLVFSVTEWEGDNDFSLELLFNTNLFRQGTMERFVHSYKHIFEQLGENKRLSTIDLIPAEERHKLIHDFNATTVSYPIDKSVVEHFMNVVQQYPNQTAVVDRGKTITYQQLNERATILAMKLMESGVRRNDIVAILLESELDLPVAMLGILKAGAAFLTVDPNYPDKRIEFMLNDSNCKLLLTKQELALPVTYATSQLFMDEIEWVCTGEKPVLPTNVPTDLAYVIYTSGTTGNPKGVMMEHKGLVNLCSWHQDVFAVTSEDRASKYAAVGFDATVWELFPYLLTGASVYLVKEEDKLDMGRLNEFFEKQQITISFLPTPIAEQFMRVKNHSLRILLTGGDRLKEYRKKPYTVVNNYGPTENTVVTTSHIVTENMANIPIGKPIANTKVYIIDANDNLLPIGVPGELCIAGDGLATGYFDNPELTAEKFVENPIEQQGKMYKTGDIAKWNEDGTITFLGRNDNQLKIRGNRVEISEIEAALLSKREIDEAVVVAVEEDQKDPMLVAYITGKQNVNIKKWKNDLMLELPHFMIPAHIIMLEQLPITANGKVDRKKLSKLEIQKDKMSSLKPTTDLEKQMYSLWSAVLKREDFGVEDDFFELGGDSLKVVYLLGDIREKIRIESAISEIYKYRTIKSFAKHVTSKQPLNDFESLTIEPAEDGIYPLGPAQKRIFIQDYYDEQSTLYNTPTTYRIKVPIDVEKLQRAFEQLIDRHVALRSTFFMKEEPVQKIQEQVEFNIEKISSNGMEVESMIESFIQPFNLQQAPLLRVKIIKIPDDDDLLFIDLHHIVCDGVSLMILLQELADLYDGKILEPHKRSYLDYISWQDRYYESEAFVKQKDFWDKKLKDYDNKDLVPIDFPRQLKENYDSHSIGFSLPNHVHERLLELTKQFKCSPFVFLKAIYVVLLHKYSNRDDLIVGCVAAGRQQPYVKRLIGMFTNTLPVRYLIDKEKSFSDFLVTVNENLLQAFDHQDYQFDEMIKNLQMDQFEGKTPLIDALFQFQDLSQQVETKEGLQLEPFEIGAMNSKFDLEIYGQQHEQGITFSINYRKNLFKETTINQLIQDYQQLVETITHNVHEKVIHLHVSSTGKWEKRKKNIFETVVFDV